jgi:hypothetical protein
MMARVSRLAVSRLGVLVLALAWAPSPAWALSIGQHDTFEDGTTQGWVVGLLGVPSPRPPVNRDTGGPAGAGDRFLFLTALGGAGAGSRLAAINVSQWTGDFIAAGISGIAMDLRNLGPSDLSLRLSFADPSGGPPANWAVSTTAFFLPAGGAWVAAFFPIGPADLTALDGSVTAALQGTTELRLFHSTSAAFPGDPIAASLGVDNITATPEPTSAALLGSSLLVLYSWHRTRRARRGRA